MSSFTAEGYQSFPSLKADNDRVGEFSEWDTEVLESRLREYGQFLDSHPMPRAESTAKRIAAHIIFELMYRRGAFGDIEVEIRGNA